MHVTEQQCVVSQGWDCGRHDIEGVQSGCAEAASKPTGRLVSILSWMSGADAIPSIWSLVDSSSLSQASSSSSSGGRLPPDGSVSPLRTRLFFPARRSCNLWLRMSGITAHIIGPAHPPPSSLQGWRDNHVSRVRFASKKFNVPNASQTGLPLTQLMRTASPESDRSRNCRPLPNTSLTAISVQIEFLLLGP